MSRRILKDKDGTYRKVIEDEKKCRFMINGICCHERSKCYRKFPMTAPYTERKCDSRLSCRLFEKEFLIKSKFARYTDKNDA